MPEIARKVAPDVRVVYADIDPIVLAHGRAILGADERTTVIRADLRIPESVCDAPDTRALIDTGRPGGGPRVVPDPPPRRRRGPGGRRAGRSRTVSPPAPTCSGRFRTRAEQEPYYEGLELVEPRLVCANDWRADTLTPRDSPVRRRYVGAVGRKA